MATFLEQAQWARNIDQRVQQRVEQGGDEALIQHMDELMEDYYRLLNQASHEQLNDLALRYPYFWHFSKVLECLAEAIEDGEISVPSVH